MNKSKQTLVMGWRENWKEIILFVLSMTFLLIMALYKLTETPLWLDECLEYYIGRTMTGVIPWYSNNGVTTAANMYERMLGGFQPPLYNFLSYFWLLISDTEWWFRFSGVIMCAIGGIGIYKVVKKISNYSLGALSVICYSCVYEIMYYTQECGEYIMLVMFLPWLFLWYLKAMEEHSFRNMLCFVLFCVLTIYTQYGAAFIIAPTAVSILIKVWMDGREHAAQRKKQLTWFISFSGTAVILAALPLLFFFVLPQLANQTNVEANPEIWNFYNNNVFSDIVHMFLDVFRWNLIESFTRFYTISLIAVIVLLLMSIFYCVKGTDGTLKHLLICNVFTWFLYYVPTRAGLYGRGYFGFRYNIFFIPMWIITLFYLFYRLYQMLDGIEGEKKRKLLKRVYQTGMLVMAAGYCIYGSHQILKHWEKADTRGCVQAWYAEKGYDASTLVEPMQAPAFSYYYEHDEAYNSEYDARVHRLIAPIADNIYHDDIERQQYEGYKQEIQEIYGDNWPDTIYCFVGDIDNSPVSDVLKDAGYEPEEIYRTTAQLYRFDKIQQEE
ncbi:MAG: glycosyltransferase family 39 protein [Lachnospiraceae bacterium]|nr:glycosyltransferase family 39 protein [Lachnospiraceae bacterium]